MTFLTNHDYNMWRSIQKLIDPDFKLKEQVKNPSNKRHKKFRGKFKKNKNKKKFKSKDNQDNKNFKFKKKFKKRKRPKSFSFKIHKKR